MRDERWRANGEIAMNGALSVSWRYLNGKKSPLVALISRFSTFGIALGVMVLIVGLSAMNGFERELNNRILAVVPQVEISAYSPTKQQAFIEKVKILRNLVAEEKSVEASSPFVRFQGVLQNGTKLKVVQVQGVDPKTQPQVSQLHQFVEGEGWQRFQEMDGLILGAGIAKDLNVKVGDWVSLMLTENSEENLSQVQQQSFPIAGILRLHGQLDHLYALMPLKTAQKLLNLNENQATGIELKVKAPFQVNQLTFPSLQTYPEALQAQTWMNRFGYMYQDIQLIRTVMYLAMVLVIAVACFNIVSTLMMAVKDKQNDIAILRTLGADKSFIKKIFIFYGLFSGLKGAIIGVVLGVFVSLNLTVIIKGIEQLIDYQFLSSGIYFIDFLPSELHLFDVVLVLVVSILLSLVASLYPAHRASNLPPAKILMHKS